MDTSKPVEFKIVSELPKTEKNIADLARKAAIQRQIEEDKLQQQKLSEEQLRLKKDQEWKLEQERRDQEKRRLEEERRKKEEEEQRSTLEGKLAKFITDLNHDASDSEFSLAGIEMSDVRFRIVANSLETNTTLKDMHMCRKGIQDDEGAYLMKSLKMNSTIEKIELEGNNLGTKFLTELGEFLSHNDTLKYLDIECNDLYDPALSDKRGIEALAEGIQDNLCLLALNISGCGLDDDCGRILADALENNYSIIHFDFRDNKFELKTQRRLVASLVRNKELYDSDRYREWRERKMMKRDDEYTEMIDITLQQEHIKNMNILSREEANRKEKEIRWEEEQLKKEYEMKREMDRLVNEAKKRQETGKRRKRGGKKKK